MAEEIREFPGLMRPLGLAAEHAFGSQLEEWAVEGVPVECGGDWLTEEILAVVE